MFTLPYTSRTDLTGCGTPYSSRCFSWHWWWYPRCGQVPTFWINLLSAPMILAFLSFPERQNCGGDEGNVSHPSRQKVGSLQEWSLWEIFAERFHNSERGDQPRIPRTRQTACLSVWIAPCLHVSIHGVGVGVKFRFYLNWNWCGCL